MKDSVIVHIKVNIQRGTHSELMVDEDLDLSIPKDWKRLDDILGRAREKAFEILTKEVD